jgi:hypothetical protein
MDGEVATTVIFARVYLATDTLRSEVEPIRSFGSRPPSMRGRKSADRRARLRVTRPFMTPFNQLLTP